MTHGKANTVHGKHTRAPGGRCWWFGQRGMSTIGVVLLVVLVLLLLSALPGMGFHGFGWGPSGLLLVVLAVVLVLLLTGRL